jgi:predicted ester cyclase
MRNAVSEQQNEQGFSKVIEQAYSRGNIGVLDKAFVPNFVEHQAGILSPTAEGVGKSIAYLRRAFPDLKLTIEEIIASGDKPWARIAARGTHQGPFMGLPPAGKPIAITVLEE